MTHKVLTANDLSTGEVVFLTPNGQWSQHFHRARIASDLIEADSLLENGIEDEHRNVVVGVYLIDVELINGVPRATRYREQLRITGPSIHPQFRKALTDRLESP